MAIATNGHLAAGLRLGADGSLEEMRLEGPPHDLAEAQ
jgi:hypothetical protein